MSKMNNFSMPEEARVSSRTRLKEASVPKLPPLSINTMTQGQLREFVPELMKIVAGQGDSSWSLEVPCRPLWWPPDVPWGTGATERKEYTLTDALKKVVRNCYCYLGQEDLLSAGKISDWKACLSKLQTRFRTGRAREQLPDLLPPQDYSEHGRSGNSKKPFVEIYVCFFCAKEFMEKEVMRKHQSDCDQRPPELQAINTPPRIVKERSTCPKLSPVHPQSEKPRIHPSVDSFMQKLNLIPVSKAKKIREISRRNTEVDCSALDIGEPQTPVSPTTPKTPKLLISQLSRESEPGSCKRRLSYLSLHEDHSDAESTTSGGSEDLEEKQKPRKSVSLLNIEMSSPLGQRIQKHLKIESSVQIVNNVEDYCKTPVKNKFLEKLRNRANPYPITYKPRKKKQRQYCHSYKFSRAQRIEYYMKLKTGLNRKSRNLCKLLPKCKLILARLTMKDLKSWMPFWKKPSLTYKPNPRATFISPTKYNKQCTFPEGPTLLSEDIDKVLGLRKKEKGKKADHSLSLANMVSEDTNAEVLQQKVAVYRSLLTDLSSSGFVIHSPEKTSNRKASGQQRKGTQSGKDCPNMQSIAQKYSQISASLLAPPNFDYKSKRKAFPRFTRFLECHPSPASALTPSSSSSSPDSLKTVVQTKLNQPLQIDIPSHGLLLNLGFPFSLTSNTSHSEIGLKECISPDDAISITTVSSDEETWKSTCCTGCRERIQCSCTPSDVDKCNQKDRSELVLKENEKSVPSSNSEPIKLLSKQEKQTSESDSISEVRALVPEDRKGNVSVDECETSKLITKQGKINCSSGGGTEHSKPKSSEKSQENIRQYSLRRQASAPAGSAKYTLRSTSPIKTLKAVSPAKMKSYSPVKTQFLPSTNTVKQLTFKTSSHPQLSKPISPMRGLKRASSLKDSSGGPTSVAPSPKKRKLDVPRTRSNSIVIMK